MDIKRCAGCSRRFEVCPQVPKQCYCSAPRCQRERRRRSQRDKRKSDPIYKDNQLRAQQAWSKRNKNYWHDYRLAHPEYCKRNREMQGGRNEKRKKLIAKMDVSGPNFPMYSGIYRLEPIDREGIAKMDAWIVEINFISSAYTSLVAFQSANENCKETT